MVVGDVPQVPHLDRDRGAPLVPRFDQQLVGDFPLPISVGGGDADVAQPGLGPGVNLRVQFNLHQPVVREVDRQDHELEELPLSIRRVGSYCRQGHQSARRQNDGGDSADGKQPETDFRSVAQTGTP